MQQSLGRLKRVWSGELAADAVWLLKGVAIVGDFAGIQAYVLRPVPGARGAAKRLRARSFRVAERTLRIAEAVCQEFGAASPYYVAGGRFLVSAPLQDGWRARLATLQASIDRKLFDRFGGEVAFHLAATDYAGGVPTQALFDELQRRRARPLEYALMPEGGWSEKKFFDKAVGEWYKCPACLRTVPRLREVAGEVICEGCARDIEIGTRLSRWNFDPGKVPHVRREDVVHHFPMIGDQPASFEDLVTKAAGKQWLGHLRIDADHAGKNFLKLGGDPTRIWGLSRLLHTFFCQRVQELIKDSFVYPVYGGGDDLYVIGPWNLVLDLAEKLRDEFEACTGPEGLTFSAGFALGKPHQHILTKSEEAAAALEKAKKQGRNRICALGTVMQWNEFREVLREGKAVCQWYKPAAGSASLPSGFLQDVLWLAQTQGDVERGLWKPLLRHQVVRNLKPPGKIDEGCEKWVRGLMAGGPEWQRAAVAVRYALLAAQQAKD